ncbi:MAG: hypothetical protein ACLPR9_11900 [Acidimicrobiales bacterium]
MTTTSLPDEMATLAASISDSDDRMDFSVRSLSVLDSELMEPLGAERRAAVAAYLGEVIRRNSSVEVVWQWPPPKGIYPDCAHLKVAGQHYLCPDQRVGPDWKPAPNDSLVDYADRAITLVANPTKETAEHLGLKPAYKFPTVWAGIRDVWTRRQRRRMGHVPS